MVCSYQRRYWRRQCWRSSGRFRREKGREVLAENPDKSRSPGAWASARRSCRGEAGKEGKRQVTNNMENKMRTRRLISALALAALVAGSSGQSDAQKPTKGEAPSVAEIAVGQRYQAMVNNLLDTVEKCNTQRQGKGDTIPWCDVYEEQVKQTSIDVFVFAQIGSKLRTKLTAGDVELLKRHIMNTAVVSYYYGKEKGEAGK